MLKFFRRSLRTTLIAVVAGLVALATIGLGALTFNAARDSLANATTAQLYAVAQAKEDHIITVVDMIESQMAQLSRMPEFRALVQKQSRQPVTSEAEEDAEATPRNTPDTTGVARDVLAAAVERKQFSRVYVVDTTGKILLSSRRKDEGDDVSGANWWKGAVAGPVIGELVLNAEDKPVFHVSHPIVSADGSKTVGVVAADASADRIYALLTDRSGMGDTGESYLINREGLMLSPSRSVKNAEFSHQQTGGAYRFIKENQGESGSWTNYRNEPVMGFAMYDHLEANGMKDWVLVTEVSEREALGPVTRLRNQIVFFTLGLIGLALALAYLLARSITNPIVRIANAAERVGSGDLGVDIEASDRVDEVGVLVTAFRTMTNNLRDILRSLQSGVGSLSSNATQITATAKEYAGTTAEQASAIAQASTTIEEIKQTSAAAADTARAVVEAADLAAESGQQGREAINSAVATMDVIATRVGGIASKILQLSEQNQQIGEIVESVNDLAEQSNLLAVNASIEAAKAGEQGRGFAVVASEVRNLAEQSKRATQQIRGILVEIQKATESAVMATEEGTKRTEDGKGAIDAVRSVVEELATTLEQNADSARQIAGAASQQASGIAQISSTLEAVSKAGRDAATGVQSLEQSVSDLSSFSSNLNDIAARYSL